MDEIEIKMDDQDFMKAFYNLEYRKFVFVLNSLLFSTNDQLAKFGSRAYIIDDHSPEFQFLTKPLN